MRSLAATVVGSIVGWCLLNAVLWFVDSPWRFGWYR